MYTIHLVRHCLATGQEPEAPLSTKGSAQAASLAYVFDGLPVDVIITSPYTRAIQSAEPLATRRQISLQVDERLRERMLGCTGTLHWREALKATFDDIDLVFPHGESSRQAVERACCVLSDAADHGLQNIVVMTHGNLMALLLKSFDASLEFDTWACLTNPDVYRLTISEGNISLVRTWPLQEKGQ